MGRRDPRRAERPKRDLRLPREAPAQLHPRGADQRRRQRPRQPSRVATNRRYEPRQGELGGRAFGAQRGSTRHTTSHGMTCLAAVGICHRAEGRDS